METLTYAKICIVLTVIHAGLTVHQLTLSYAYFQSRLREIKGAMQMDEEVSSLRWLSFLFYFVLPATYLVLLRLAKVAPALVYAGVAKFAATAALGLWTEQAVFRGAGYDKRLHWAGKIDNALNLIYAAAVLFQLIRPLP